MRKDRGFTLIETMVVVAILGILAALSVFALREAVRKARITGDRFTITRLMTVAKSRAIARGHDVYVVFADIEKTTVATDAASLQNVPRVMLYDDPAMDVRGLAEGKQILSVVELAANSANIRERLVATRQSGLNFVLTGAAPACTLTAATLPVYAIPSTTARKTAQNCASTACTFCEMNNGKCVGAIRFTADGQARIITGSNPGSERGGVVRLSDRTDARNGVCLVISEPSGQVMSLTR